MTILSPRASRRRLSVLLICVAALPAPAFAGLQQPASTPPAPPATSPVEGAAPTSQMAPAEGMFAVIQMVEGTVRVRMSRDDKWQPATVGMQLPEGAEIQTSIRGACRCAIPPDQTFVVDRLTTVELTQAFRQGNLVKTDLTMKYGRTQYEIQKAGLEHDARITSPGSTLAVRGTIVELEDSPPFRPRAISYTGRARFSAANKTTSVGAAGGQRAALEAGQQNAATAALIASVVDPQNAASRTPADARLIAQQVSLGGVASIDRQTNITVIRGGSGPIRPEADLITGLPGTLAFVARWTGDADINLAIGVSRGDPATTVLATGEFKFSEFIYPGFGLNVSASGGRTDFDHRGGANGGQEVVYWPKGFPFPATYGISVINAGGEAATVTINAYLNGQKIDLYDFAPFVPYTPEGVKSTTFTYTLNNGEIAAPLVFLPLASDHVFSGIPDANEGAPADLPITVPPAPAIPPTEGLRGLTAKQAAKAIAKERRADLKAAKNPKFRQPGGAGKRSR